MSDKASEVVKSITPAQLAKTRAEVHAEVDKAREPEPEPESEEVSVEVETVESEPPEVDCEAERLAKLDLISDVQLILVDRYRSGLRLLTACMFLSIAVLGAQVLQFFRTMSLHGSVIVLQDEQRKLLTEQEKAATAAEANKKEVAEVRLAVQQTQDKVEEAVEASPKIEIDEKGKAKVVVPVKKPKDEDEKDQKTVKKGDSKPAPSPKTPATQQEVPFDNPPVELK